MIVRTENAPRLSATWRYGVMLLLLGACAGAGACKRKPKPFPPGPQLSTATTEGAALARDSGGAPIALGAGPSSALTVTPAPPIRPIPPAPADTLSAADRAALEQAKAAIADLEVMVKKGVVTNPDKPEDGDATTRCTALEEARPRLEGLTDADATKAVADTKRLCSLEVPILNADRALKQVTLSPSQASRKLICGFASKDIDKARRVSATDRRVRDLDARFTRSCR